MIGRAILHRFTDALVLSLTAGSTGRASNRDGTPSLPCVLGREVIVVRVIALDMADPDPEAVARAYYTAIDEGRYDDLEALLAPRFVHDRPDRVLDSPDEFVRFMREERPLTDTTHAVDAIYRNTGRVAARGRLCHDAETLFTFLDVHTIENGRISHLRTYTE